MSALGNVVKTLQEQGKINPPNWVAENTQYLTIMGSVAYGVSNDTSDMDLYGFTIPPKDMVFPHLRGEIPGFGRQIQRFEQFQKHHVVLEDPRGEKHNREVDMSVYSIVKYFQLCMMCNPNMIDSMFTPERCVLVNTKIGRIMRDNRKLFLSKKAWHSFKGYAYAQLRKATTKKPEGKRVETVEKYGWDVKFGYHVVRLVLEVEQILRDCDLELDRKDAREHMKAVRAGEYSLEDIKKWFYDREVSLGKLYDSSPLRHSPDEGAIKQVLLNCLEEHFGSLSAVVPNTDKLAAALRAIRDIADDTL